LVRESKVEAEASGLIQILGDGRRDEILAFIGIDVERPSFLMFLFSATLCCRSEARQEQRRKHVGVLLVDLVTFG
jgi:hypothetical protein